MNFRKISRKLSKKPQGFAYLSWFLLPKSQKSLIMQNKIELVARPESWWRVVAIASVPLEVGLDDGPVEVGADLVHHQAAATNLATLLKVELQKLLADGLANVVVI